VNNIGKMFEFEEAGGLHDVFLNRHAVSLRKAIFIISSAKCSLIIQDGGFTFTHTLKAGNVDCYSGQKEFYCRGAGERLF
jgi:hypothetical protein